MGKRIYTLLNKLVMVLSFDSLRKKSVGIILILRLVSVRGTNFSQICMSEKKKSFRDHPAHQVLRNRLSAAISAKYKKKKEPASWNMASLQNHVLNRNAVCLLCDCQFLPPSAQVLHLCGGEGNNGKWLLGDPLMFSFVYNQLYTVKVCFFYFYAFHDNTEWKILFFLLTSSECDVSFYVNGFYYPPYGGVLLIF